MRLLINAVGASLGGATRHLVPFLEQIELARPEWTLHVFVTRGALAGGSLPTTAATHEVRRAGPLQRLRWDTREVAHAAAELRADTIVNLTNYGPVSPPVPSILYQRNSLYFDPAWLASRPLDERARARLRRELAYRQLAASAAAIVPSYAMASYLRSWRACDPGTRLRVVPHGVDCARFAFKPHTAAPDGSVRILNVSHPAPHKAFEVALQMVVRLRGQGLNASLVLTAGPSDDTRYIRKIDTMVKRLGLTQHVDLLGRIGDPERLYGDCDVFISTSRTESFGFPLLEAMASGAPIAVSAIPSHVELLAGHGELFNPDDADAAAAAVRRVLDLSPSVQSERLAQARQRAEAYSWQRNAEAITGIIEEVAAK